MSEKIRKVLQCVVVCAIFALGVCVWSNTSIEAYAEEYADQTPSPSPSGDNSTADSGSAIPETVPAGKPHICNFEWIVTLEPTKYTDGIVSYMCEECEAVKATQPISGNQVEVKEFKTLIKDAEQGETVEFNFGVLNCFNKEMLQLVDQRKDLTIKITFTDLVTGKTYTFVIPAREDGTTILEDGVNFYGFHYVGDKYDKTEVSE